MATLSFKDRSTNHRHFHPCLGVSWSPPESERKIVRETFIFLEDRRALYNDFAPEIEHEVAQSVLAIRSELTAALKRLPETSEAVAPFKAMRGACREYLDGARPQPRGYGPFSFMSQLGRLRAIIGVHVAYLAVKYGIDVDGELYGLFHRIFEMLNIWRRKGLPRYAPDRPKTEWRVMLKSLALGTQIPAAEGSVVNCWREVLLFLGPGESGFQ